METYQIGRSLGNHEARISYVERFHHDRLTTLEAEAKDAKRSINLLRRMVGSGLLIMLAINSAVQNDRLTDLLQRLIQFIILRS